MQSGCDFLVLENAVDLQFGILGDPFRGLEEEGAPGPGCLLAMSPAEGTENPSDLSGL